MTDEWPPHKPLPPGFPLPSVDKEGRAIKAGTKVRILSVQSCARGLPAEDQARLRSYEGQVFDVLQIDRYGMVWFGSEGSSSPSFSLRPEEIAVV
jgi:hypothetical protein